MDILEIIANDILDGEMDEIADHVQEALDAGIAPKTILDDGMLKGMNVVGEQFKEGELFVPEVLMSAKTMDEGMEVLKPNLQEGDVTKAGTIVMATVKGDLHDIGKKLVCMMLEGAGFEIHDLGVDVTPEAIRDAVKENNPDIVGMSAILTTTMLSMQDTVALLKQDEGTKDVKIMIGGAPANPDVATEMGANYSADASAAVDLAVSLVKA
jgi:5-methyltetrahydrofolate--homocysteine methyltransferase